MKISIVRISEPLPIDNPPPRLMRMGLLAEHLASKGHQVTWWTSDHDHANSRLRFGEDKTIKISPNYELNLISGPCYIKRVSIKRLWHNFIISKKLTNRLELASRSDIFVISMPFIDIAIATAKYCIKHNIPYIVDLRDMWPEVLVFRVFKNFPQIGKICITPLDLKLKFLLKNAQAIWGISPGFLQWGLNKISREKTPFDQYFYLSNKPKKGNQANSDILTKYHITKNTYEMIIAYVGNMSTHQVALDKIIPWIKKTNLKIKLIIAGSGDTLDLYKSLADNDSRFIFTGWITSVEIAAIYELTDLALFPYYTTPDFSISVPNKVIEYLSYGKPILSTMEGDITNLIVEKNAGFFTKLEERDFISNLRSINDSRESLKLKSISAKNLYLNNFDSQKTYDAMESAILDVLNKKT